MLTKLGIFIFNEAGDTQPQLFIPIGGALGNIVSNPLGEVLPYCFKIIQDKTDIFYLFSAKSKSDLDEWHEAIHNLQKDSIKDDIISREQQAYKEEENLIIEEEIEPYDSSDDQK